MFYQVNFDQVSKSKSVEKISQLLGFSVGVSYNNLGSKLINRPLTPIARHTTHFSFFILKENLKTTLRENDFSVKKNFHLYFSAQLLHLSRVNPGDPLPLGNKVDSTSG